MLYEPIRNLRARIAENCPLICAVGILPYANALREVVNLVRERNTASPTSPFGAAYVIPDGLVNVNESRNCPSATQNAIIAVATRAVCDRGEYQRAMLDNETLADSIICNLVGKSVLDSPPNAAIAPTQAQAVKLRNTNLVAFEMTIDGLFVTYIGVSVPLYFRCAP